MSEPNPRGICMCGCGQVTPLAHRTDSRHGIVKGAHLRYIAGHGTHTPSTADWWFWPKVNKTDSCWIWTGYRTEDGYGRLSMQGRKLRTHQIAYLLTKGKPKGIVCHRCNTPACVNPSHLYDGTPMSNTRDRVLAGISCASVGSHHGNAKLTEQQAMTIRQSTGTPTELGKHFGVTRRVIWLIRTGRAWTHLPPPDAIYTHTEGRLIAKPKRVKRGKKAA